MSFFTSDFMADQFSTDTNQSAQGQLSSQYTAALTANLQTAAIADYLAYLYFKDGHTVAEALALKAEIVAGNFSLTDLFGAAQSKTGPVDGEAVADPHPTLTMSGAFEGVSFDLTAILDGLDTETWSYVDTINQGKKVSTVETFHTREFYTDTKEPEGYEDDWAVEDPDPGQGEWVQDTLTATFIKDHDSNLDTWLAQTFELEGDEWQNVVLSATATGDLDKSDEGVLVSGEVTLSLAGAGGPGPNQEPNQPSYVPTTLNDLNNPVDESAYDDGVITYNVAFTEQVNPGADTTLTLTLTYEYWVA